MPTPPSDDWLDNLLTSEPEYIDDDGFTSQVVSALPSSPTGVWRRRIILGFATLCAMLAGFLIRPTTQDLGRWINAAGDSVTLIQNFSMMTTAAFAALFVFSSLIFLSREK